MVTLDRQDRGLWDTREIAEGIRVLQSALAARGHLHELDGDLPAAATAYAEAAAPAAARPPEP